MAEKLVVHLKDLIVVDKKIADFTDFLSLTGSYLLDPVRGLALHYVGELHPFAAIGYHDV